MVKKEKVIIASILFASIIFIQNVNISNADTKDIDLLIDKSVKKFQQVSDYTCILEKKVNKRGIVYYDPEIKVKFKKPAHYYFRWSKGKLKGREVIYAEGRNHNTIVAHSGGLFRFVTLHLNPEGRMAMKRNHHSLRRSGMEKIFDILDESYSKYRSTGCGSIILKGESRIDNRTVLVIQGEFPERMDFYAAKIIMYMDKEHMLPIKVSVYDRSGKLYEEYSFHDLKINVGLDEHDFDPENSEYNFK